MDGESRGFSWGDEWDDRPLGEWPVGRLFGIAARRVGTVWLRLAERYGISMGALAVLMALDEADGAKSGEVAERTWITPATLTSVVDTLERDGLVSRVRDPRDRRVVRLHLTPVGRVRLVAVRAALVADFRELFDFVDPADEPAVRRFLIAMIERFTPLAKGASSWPSRPSRP